MPNKSETELIPIYGWLVAANPLGQLIFSPILGMLANKLNGSIRAVGIGCSVMFIAGNFLYAIPSLLPEGNGRVVLLFISRFLTGASSGITTVISLVPL